MFLPRFVCWVKFDTVYVISLFMPIKVSESESSLALRHNDGGPENNAWCGESG